MPYTLRQVRILRAPVERVFRALTQANAIVKWNAPDGFAAEVHELDFRVGGRFRISFINFASGEAHTFGGEYKEIVENERVVASDRFEGIDGEMVAIYTLREVSSGTELTVEQQGLPDFIPEDGCRLGWQQSFDLLARLVEPDLSAAG